MTSSAGAKAAPVAQFPLTEAQIGLWYAQKIDPQNPILNTGQYLEIRGPLIAELLAAAVQQTIDESDVFRLRIVEREGLPRQEINPAARATFRMVDLSAAQDPMAAARADMSRDASAPLDLSKDPLAAFVLYRLAADHHLLYERIHHLAVDGYGMVLVTNRIAEIYSASVSGDAVTSAFQPLSVAIEEDALYRESERRTTDRQFWKEALAELPDVEGLKSGRPQSARTFHRHQVHLEPTFSEGLKALAAEAQTTWPDAIVALAAAYVQRFAQTSEVVVGVPFMGRLGSRTARVPCTLMNILPVRVAIDEDVPLLEFLADVGKRLVRSRRHGRYRSEQIRREKGLVGGARRLFGPLINVQPFDLPPKIAGLEVDLHILGAGAVDDATFTFRGDAVEGLTFEGDFNPDLYSENEARNHAERLISFIRDVIECRSLAATPTATPAERQCFVFDLNATEHPVSDTTLVALIEQTMFDKPDAEALRFNGRSLTYGELDRRSSALSKQLEELGAGRDKVVAVALPRSFELVVALVAVLRSGAAYLPLDPENPPERLQRILDAARPVTLLALPELADEFLSRVHVLSPEDWSREGRAEAANVAPGDLAYVIYTSGSTGEPKGVAVEHRAIVNRLEWMRAHYEFSTEDRFLQKTPATFDVSVWEFFLPLMMGAALVIAPPGAHRDPTAMARIIRQERITTAHFVPSMLSVFLNAPEVRGLEMARVFCSGEELSPDLRDRFHRVVGAELHNLYGPTEAAVDVSYWPAGPDDTSRPVPIGRPVWNTRLYVLDERQRPLPAGVDGHLWLGGVQLARGYLGRPDLTAERFRPDLFRPGERMYATGDIARFREDGAAIFLGRSDYQVKVRGLRIELGEIETALLKLTSVRDVAVIVREDRPGDKRIVSYVVPAGDSFDESEARQVLARQLPDYMVPSAFVVLDALPLSANGKLDRKKLPVPERGTGQGRGAETDTEKKVAALFAEVLGLPREPLADEDFFELGGDSLLAVTLMLRIADTWGDSPGLGSVFAQPTVAGLAAIIEDGQRFDDGLQPIMRLSGADSGLPPLFIVHPAGGIAWGYRALANALAGKREVWGMQSPMLDLSVPSFESMETLAADYANRIEAACPRGIAHLAGWSVGGIIAQATAVHLQARGRKVGMLAMLDSYPSECWRAEPEPDEAAALRALLAIAGFDPEAYPHLTTREAIVDFLRNGDSALGRLPHKALDGVVRVVTGTNRLVRGHYHRRYDGVLTHVRAALDHEGRNLVPELWSAHAAEVDALAIPFLHPQMTSEDAVAVMAPELLRRMQASEAAEQS